MAEKYAITLFICTHIHITEKKSQGSGKRLTSIKVGDVGGGLPQTLTDVTVGGTVLEAPCTWGVRPAPIMGGATPPNDVVTHLAVPHPEKVGTIRIVRRGGREKPKLTVYI